MVKSHYDRSYQVLLSYATIRKFEFDFYFFKGVTKDRRSIGLTSRSNIVEPFLKKGKLSEEKTYILECGIIVGFGERYTLQLNSQN